MIDPYGILCNVRIFSLGWHILAFCHKTKEIRAFNFIHINKMTPLNDSQFELPQNFSVKKYTIEVLDEAEKLCSKGFDLYSKNKYIEAVQFYKKAISLYPAYGDAHFFIALSYLFIGDNEAVEEFERALEYECADPEIVYSHLSNCFLSMGEKDKAIEACKNAIRIKPKNTGYHIHLAEIYTNMEKYNEAIEEYQEVIKLKSNWEDIEDLKEFKKAYQGLADCYKKIDMMDKVNECNDILYDLALEEEEINEE
jgi:tetratricopeptide (TPR) repeat protein